MVTQMSTQSCVWCYACGLSWMCFGNSLPCESTWRNSSLSLHSKLKCPEFVLPDNFLSNKQIIYLYFVCWAHFFLGLKAPLVNYKKESLMAQTEGHNVGEPREKLLSLEMVLSHGLKFRLSDDWFMTITSIKT